MKGRRFSAAFKARVARAALEKALAISQPEIFNTDQRAQYNQRHVYRAAQGSRRAD